MLHSNNRICPSSESLRQSQVDECPGGNATNLEQILECYQTEEECAHSAVSFDITTSHRPNPAARSEGASEAPSAPSPSHPQGPSTAGHALTSRSDDRLPQPTSVHTSAQLQMLPLVFAVEVSSTSERVFQQEKNTISYITSKLDPKQLADESYIVPWDRQAHDPVSAHLIGNLQHSVGSNPSSMFENHLGRRCLDQSKIWFLMTDGVIEEERANAFTNNVAETGLHGTPSVIIVFGNRSRPPSRSKLSIGMSICALSPHCVVLFHDVWSNEQFVVQAKGCFASLLRKGSYFKWFSGTKWADFPQTSYDRLLRVHVPEPIRLSKDEVALPYGNVFDMKSMYNDSMSDRDKLQLVSSNCALDATMVVAKARGEGFLVKLWIESLRRTTTRGSLTIERDDVNSRGMTTMTYLLIAAEKELKAPNTRHKDIWSCLTSIAESSTMQIHGPSNLDFHRASLRFENQRNWANFEAKVEMERAALNRVAKGLQEVQSAIGILDDPLPNDPSLAPSDTFWYPASGVKAGRDNEKLPASVPPKKLDKHDIDKALFLSGFKGTRKLETVARSKAYATCPVCREPNSIQTLLLRTSPKDNKTPHLPLPNQRLQLKCPLALGNCPEVDIILPLTCCDGCAFILLRMNKDANPRLPRLTSHEIVAALPLVSLQDRQNRRLWRQTLAEVFRHRFHDSTVLSIFLAAICTQIENVPSLARSKTLKWCRDELSQLPGIHVPKSASPKLVTSLPSAVDNMVPPQQVAFFACLGNKFYLKTVLSQPVEGFVVLFQLAASMKVVKPEAVRNLVWKRLLCHFIEQDLRLRTNFGIQYASAALQEIIQESLSSSQRRHDKFVIALPKQRTSISLTSLVDTYLIPPGSSAISQFFRIACFGEVYSTTAYNAALAVFFNILASIKYHGQEAMDVLEEMQGVAKKFRHFGEDMRSVFEDPTSVEEPGAAYVIAHLESWLKGIVSRS